MNGRELVDRDQDDLDGHEEWEDWDEEFPYGDDTPLDDLDFDVDALEVGTRLEPRSEDLDNPDVERFYVDIREALTEASFRSPTETRYE